MLLSVERTDDAIWRGDALVLKNWKCHYPLPPATFVGETPLRRNRQGFTLLDAPARCAPVLRRACVFLVLLGLAVLPTQAQGAPASFVLTWLHQQDTSTPATGYAVQRCIQSDTACNMSDLPGATQIPYTTPTYTDSTIQPNITYCYQVAAVNQFGRSPYSSIFCGQLGGFPKNAPNGLQLKIVPATP